MRGTVKWFSKEKGYGFIVGNDNIDRFFSVRDISGVNLPNTGDIVDFQDKQSKKGPAATSINIISSAKTIASFNDDKVVCADCGKRMVPRMITYNGSPSKSVCPFCGATYKKFGYCFIATAVYKSYDAPEVLVLRNFRDKYLATNFLGRIFIKTYYFISPYFANKIAKSEKWTKIIKKILDKLIYKLQ